VTEVITQVAGVDSKPAAVEGTACCALLLSTDNVSQLSSINSLFAGHCFPKGKKKKGKKKNNKKDDAEKLKALFLLLFLFFFPCLFVSKGLACLKLVDVKPWNESLLRMVLTAPTAAHLPSTHSIWSCRLLWT